MMWAGRRARVGVEGGRGEVRDEVIVEVAFVNDILWIMRTRVSR